MLATNLPCYFKKALNKKLFKSQNQNGSYRTKIIKGDFLILIFGPMLVQGSRNDITVKKTSTYPFADLGFVAFVGFVFDVEVVDWVFADFVPVDSFSFVDSFVVAAAEIIDLNCQEQSKHLLQTEIKLRPFKWSYITIKLLLHYIFKILILPTPFKILPPTHQSLNSTSICDRPGLILFVPIPFHFLANNSALSNYPPTPIEYN